MRISRAVLRLRVAFDLLLQQRISLALILFFAEFHINCFCSSEKFIYSDTVLLANFTHADFVLQMISLTLILFFRKFNLH